MQRNDGRPCAVVVGLCAHGLGIARTLHAAGVEVFALEADEHLPGLRTRSAKVRIVHDINGPGLIEALIQVASTLPGQRPVLFLTNDRMVETIGGAIDRIAPFYRLSWASSTAAILPLLRKDEIEARARKVGLHYPQTRVIDDVAQLLPGVAGLRFPVIVKPTRPISAFKTLVAESQGALVAGASTISQSMPVVVQEFIPGDDRTIRFGALYLQEGRVLARFEGRKLRSWPMGHTTVAVSERDDALHALACRFFDGLRVSGPASLELKRDPDGTDWVIEPTIGRTDFWVGLCIANGVNLPLIEYATACGQTCSSAQTDTHIWINGERDPAVLPWLLAHAPGVLLSRRLVGVYASFKDAGPFTGALTRYIAALPSRAVRKARRIAFSN